MNKKILRKIFWVTTLVLLLSVVVCFSVIYGITYYSKYKLIEKNMPAYNESIEAAKSVEELDAAIGDGEGLMYVGVLSSEGSLIVSNISISGEELYVKDAEFI